MEFPCNQCTDDPIASNTKKEQGESTLNERDPAINRNECTDASSATLEVDSFVKRHSKGQALFLNFSSDLSPQKVNKAPKKCKRQAAYRVNGVNILNRNNLDSKTVIERIQKRRENHNHVERRRRDNINSTILELSQIVPNALQPNQKPNKGNILKLTLDYVKKLQADNILLKSRQLSTSYFPSSMNDSTTGGNSIHKNIQSAPSSPTLSSKPRMTVDNEFQQNIQSTSLPCSPMLLHYSQYCQQNNRTEGSQRLGTRQPISAASQPLPLSMSDPIVPNHIASISDSPATGIIGQCFPAAQHSTSDIPAVFPTSKIQVTPQLQYHSRYSQQLALRPLLPASSSPAPPLQFRASNNLSIQPRMSGTEKMYSGVCRY